MSVGRGRTPVLFCRSCGTVWPRSSSRALAVHERECPLLVKCPFCVAPEGEHCSGFRTGAARKPHQTRVQAGKDRLDAVQDRLTPSEAARELGISRRTIDRWLEAGSLTGQWDASGKVWVVSRSDLHSRATNPIPLN